MSILVMSEVSMSKAMFWAVQCLIIVLSIVSVSEVGIVLAGALAGIGGLVNCGCWLSGAYGHL